MKKTISVNIGGIVFQINEDAYALLKEYLDAIGSKFSAEEREEILEDIEARIAELFSSKVNDSKQIIDHNDVDQVMETLGQPEEINEEEGADHEQQSKSSYKTAKKLFRDPDNKVLGGVMSGLSHYFGIRDSIWLRLAMVALVIFGIGAPIFLYILLWIIVSEAKTSSEKLQMKGEPVNIQNIQRTVKKEFNDIRSNLSGDSKKNFNRVVDTGANAAKILLRIFLIFLGIGLFFFAFAVMIGLAATLITGLAAFFKSSVILPQFIFGSKWLFLAFLSGILLLFAIPILSLLKLSVELLSNQSRPSPVWRRASWSLWIIGAIMAGTVFFMTIFNFTSVQEQVSNIDSFTPEAKVITIKSFNEEQQRFHMKYSRGNFDLDGFVLKDEDNLLLDQLKLDIVESEDSLFHLTAISSSRGRSDRVARENIASLSFDYDRSDSILSFGKYVKLPLNEKFNDQEVQLVLRVPKGYGVYLDESIRNVIYDIENVTNTYDGNMIGNTWTMTPNGLECLGCEFSNASSWDSESEVSISNIDEVYLKGMFEVLVEQGETESLSFEGDEEVLKKLKISTDNGKLKVESTDESFFKNTQVRVLLVLKELNKLNVQGAIKLKMESFETDNISFEFEGASKADIKLITDKINLKAAGAADIELNGSADVMNVVMKGASNLDAVGFVVDLAEVTIKGAGTANVFVENDLTIDADGAVKVNYKGEPKVKAEAGPLAKIKNIN